MKPRCQQSNVTAQWVSIAVRIPVIQHALVSSNNSIKLEHYVLPQFLDECTLHINGYPYKYIKLT